MPWPRFNDRVGEEAAPQTFGSIIHQPTTPATNNYILVGGGGWGSVEHCPVSCKLTDTHTHMHAHLNELTTSKWHNQIWPKHFEVIFSPRSWLKHLGWVEASSRGEWAVSQIWEIKEPECSLCFHSKVHGLKQECPKSYHLVYIRQLTYKGNLTQSLTSYL